MKKSTPIWQTLNTDEETIHLAKAEKAKRLRKRKIQEAKDQAKAIALQKLEPPAPESLENEPKPKSEFAGRNLLPLPYGDGTLEGLLRFAYECAETQVEKTGEVRSLPRKEYIDWTFENWLACTQTGTHCLHWKPRRMIVSWLAAVYDIWDLLQFPGQVRVAALKYADDKGSMAFVWRRWFVYERLRRRYPEWNLPASHVKGDIEDGQIRRLTLPNGARITAVNSVPSSFRGSGARRVWTEELNEYRLVGKVWNQACTVIEAPEGEVDGTAFAIVNAGTNLEYQEIKKRGDGPILPGPVEGTQSWVSEIGVLILDLAYKADPSKDEAWALERSRGMTVLEWQIEMEKNEDVFEGEPVFATFLYDRHAPAAFRDSDFEVYQDSVFFAGWDCGQAKQPAFALAQLTTGGQALFMFEVVAKVPTPMRIFAPMVRELLMARLPGHWMRVRHVGDPTGGTKLKSWATGETEEFSAFDVAFQTAGFTILPSINNPTVRQDAVHWLLMSWADRSDPDPRLWSPRCYYSEKGCPVLVRGMKGAYQWTTTNVGAGQVFREPKKDFYSHVNDGHQYVAIEIYKHLNNGELPSPGQWANW